MTTAGGFGVARTEHPGVKAGRLVVEVGTVRRDERWVDVFFGEKSIYLGGWKVWFIRKTLDCLRLGGAVLQIQSRTQGRARQRFPTTPDRAHSPKFQASPSHLQVL